MAIALTTLHTNLGKAYKCLYDAHGNAAVAVATDIAAVATAVGATYPQLANLLTGQLTSLQNAGQLAISQQVQQFMRGYLLAVVNADTPQADPNSVPLALAELYRQFVSQSYKFSAVTLGLSGAAVSGNTGTGNLVLSTKRGDGRTQDNLFAEVGRLFCTADAQNSGGASIAGNEPFTYTGDYAPANVLGFDYPGYSGATAFASVVDSATATLNLLTNSDFETFTVANTPDSWTLAVGTPGTDVFSEAAIIYRGLKALKFLGTGGTRPTLRQTLTTLKPNTVYSVNLWAKAGGALTSTGTLTLSLVDGSNATINDDQGNANGFSQVLTGLTTTYTAYSGVLITPKVLPAVVKLQLEASHGANLVAAEAVYVDSLSLAPTVFLYPGGPSLNLCAGATPFMTGDAFLITATNNQNGASYGATWQRIYDRIFGARALQLLLPTAGTTLINDSLAH